jgi:hypothetical protein
MTSLGRRVTVGSWMPSGQAPKAAIEDFEVNQHVMKPLSSSKVPEMA